LILLGLKVRSRSFGILGLLILAIVIEESFHVLNPVAAHLAGIARWANGWTDLRLAVLNGALIYGGIAAVGLAIILASHRHGSVGERLVVRNLTGFLIAAGFFGGPISVLSELGNYRRWLFIEEFGEATVFAIIAGYVSGLVALMPRRELRARSSQRQED
jgi:hypothetical protein